VKSIVRNRVKKLEFFADEKLTFLKGAYFSTLRLIMVAAILDNYRDQLENPPYPNVNVVVASFGCELANPRSTTLTWGGGRGLLIIMLRCKFVKFKGESQ